MPIDAQRDQETQILSQQILHTIATNPDPLQCASTLLQIVQSATDASGACFALFDELETCVTTRNTDGDHYYATLHKLAPHLSPGVHLNPALPDGTPPFEEDLIVIVISAATDEAVVGGVCLTGSFAQLNGDMAFDEFLNAFTIVATKAEANAQHTRNEQLTTSLLSSFTDPLLVLDEHKHIVLLNPAAEALFAVSTDTASGKPVGKVVQSDELLALANGANNYQTEWVSDDGQTFVPRAEPIIATAEGEIGGWVIALHDITRFKKLNRSQYEFTRNVTHDLRSPLTSMQGFASMLELGAVGDLNERQAHFVEKILAGIGQVTALVDNIQDAGRYDPETGFYEMSRSQCDLNDLINQIAENHLLPAEKQELELVVQIAENVPIISADVNMLERGLRNLVDNAIKYTPNGGFIKLGAEVQDETITISVTDSGYGISSDNQKQLFERGVRIHREEHKRVKGSGLGLFIVRSVAQGHGGEAWVESDEGKGSTFFISIPLNDANLTGASEET